MKATIGYPLNYRYDYKTTITPEKNVIDNNSKCRKHGSFAASIDMYSNEIT